MCVTNSPIDFQEIPTHIDTTCQYTFSSLVSYDRAKMKKLAIFALTWSIFAVLVTYAVILE